MSFGIAGGGVQLSSDSSSSLEIAKGLRSKSELLPTSGDGDERSRVSSYSRLPSAALSSDLPDFHSSSSELTGNTNSYSILE